MLISQPGSDYQLAQVTLDAGNTRDITLLLLDVHGVLDHLYLDGTRPRAVGCIHKRRCPLALGTNTSGRPVSRS